MSARAGEWYLITDDGKDPVAGDPDAVSREQSYYADMAQTILAEANRLADLGHSDQLVGKFSKSLEKDLGDLSGDVRKAHQRYDDVGQALGPFARALYTARDESAAALRDAVAAHASQQQAASSPNPQQQPGGKPLTDAENSQQKAHAQAVSDADDAMRRARQRLENALSALNDAGKKAASLINDGCNDDLKDHHHWWDVVVDIIKIVVKVAGYVAMAAAIVALFIPGLDILATIALVASYAALAGDLVLFATGNGSLADVLIDVVGILTLHLGSAAAQMGKTAAEETATATTRYVERNAKTIITDGASLGRKSLRAAAREYSSSLVTETKGIANPIRSLRYAGDPELADAAENVTRAQRLFPRSTTIQAGYNSTINALNKARFYFGTGSILTGGNAIANDTSPTWNNWKDEHFNYFAGSPLHVGE